MARRSPPEVLFLTEGEVAQRLGLTCDQWSAAALQLEKIGLPFRDPLFNNKRYWPAVVAYLDWRSGLGPAPNQYGHLEDGKENWENDRARRRVRSKT